MYIFSMNPTILRKRWCYNPSLTNEETEARRGLSNLLKVTWAVGLELECVRPEPDSPPGHSTALWRRASSLSRATGSEEPLAPRSFLPGISPLPVGSRAGKLEETQDKTWSVPSLIPVEEKEFHKSALRHLRLTKSQDSEVLGSYKI